MDNRRISFLIVKIAIVILIPYYWISDVNYSNTTTNAIIGTWGIWSNSGRFSWVQDFFPFWAENQLLFSLLFIIPLIGYSLVYGERTICRRNILAAVISVATSYLALDLLTPDSIIYPITTELVVPSVVSLGIFVFVFWPLIRNSWPTIQRDQTTEEKQGVLKRIRQFQRKTIPVDAATITWFTMAFFPLVLNITWSEIPETQFQMTLQFSGGLSFTHYTYSWVIFGTHPQYYTSFVFITAFWVSIGELLIWTILLLLGITTLRYILGESTKKRVYTLVGIIFLLTAIPSMIFFITSVIFPQTYFSVPLLLFPILMLLFTRFVSAPTYHESSSPDMIDVPLRTRISSFFSRERKKQEESEKEEHQDDEMIGDSIA